MIAEQLQVKGVLDNFIEKVSGVNKPYLALKKDQQYKDFHAMFAEAIAKQAEWAAQNIHSILELSTPLEPLNGVQTTRVKDYVGQNLPSVAQMVDQDSVVDYFKFCFEWGAKAQYQRWFTRKAAGQPYENFSLTNEKYLQSLRDRANYLLNQSSLDDTTTSQIISTIISGKEDNLTNDEVAQQLSDSFDDISSDRADMIARTETANAMGDGNYATMQENGITQVEWITAGDNPCVICQENEDASPINVGDQFPSGDDHEPAHPNCECYTQAVTDDINLDDISIWDGSDG